MGFVAVVSFCCIALLAAPIATASQQSAPRVQNATDSTDQPVTTCLSGAGTSFTIGSANGTHIWFRLHAAMLTDSGGSIGAELTGSTGGTSIIEVVAGLEYVGDGFLDLLTSPIDSFDVVSGSDFQLPMLENVSTGLGNEQPSQSDADQSGDERSADDSDGTETGSDASPFEMLRC